jgi:hypothetical protein
MLKRRVAKIFLPNKNNKNSKRDGNGRPKRNHARPGKGKGSRDIVPRVAQRDQMNQIQELWTPVFPARTTRRLRYSTNITLSSTVGAVASHVFSANGLFDPDITSTGHQPMGFDQLMLSYEHYTVTGAHMLCSFKNTTTSNPNVSISVQPSPTPITAIDQIIEWGLIERDFLEFKGVSGSIKALDSRCSIRKVMGVRDIIDVTDLQGSSAANPVEQTYFVVQMWDTSGINGSCFVDVIIEYTAIFTEPRVLTASLTRTLGALLLGEEKSTEARPRLGLSRKF